MPDKVPELTGATLESCSFQDITGQRISKVVKSLHIEERVNSLINMWGSDTLAEADLDEEPEIRAISFEWTPACRQGSQSIGRRCYAGRQPSPTT